MKITTVAEFEEYVIRLEPEEREKLEAFFSEFNLHCSMSFVEKTALRQDFERALLYYAKTGVSLDDALELLAMRNLGGFYARPPLLWFPLDDAAKIYPFSMEHGKMAVFRLSTYLKKDVVPELLQMALDFTIKRFPSFATTLKKGFFWHYLDTTKRRFSVEEEHLPPCMPLHVGRSGSQSFRVIYWKNRISVECFHVLTDGTGGLEFLKALTAEYLRLCGVQIPESEYIADVNKTPDTEEMENAFARVPHAAEASGFAGKPAVQMSGKLSKCKPCRVFHFRLDATALAEAARRHGATVTAYVMAMMFVAEKAATDAVKGEAVFQVPVNMRKFYPSKTVRNFALYCGIRMPFKDTTDVDAILPAIDAQLKEKASKEAMSSMLTAAERLVNSLAIVPLVIKFPVAHMVYGFLGDRMFSNIMSNLGVVKMPKEMEEHIESMDAVLGTVSISRAACTMVSACNVATLTIAKLTMDPTFEEKMLELFQKEGLEVKVEGSEIYED